MKSALHRCMLLPPRHVQRIASGMIVSGQRQEVEAGQGCRPKAASKAGCSVDVDGAHVAAGEHWLPWNDNRGRMRSAGCQL
jgi:hypothetical protein